MTGMVCFGKTFCCREEQILGLSMLRVTLPAEGTMWRRRLFVRRAAQIMHRHGVKECVFGEDFPLKEVFARRGILTVDRRPLLKEKAGQWTLAERQARGLTGSVAVAAPRMTAEVQRAAEVLLKRAGRVELLLMPGAEELQKRLLRETGGSLRLVTDAQLFRNETLLDFGGSAAVGQALTLRMAEAGEGPHFLLPQRFARELPSGVNEEDFCVLLWRQGRLGCGEIGVKSRK